MYVRFILAAIGLINDKISLVKKTIFILKLEQLLRASGGEKNVVL